MRCRGRGLASPSVTQLHDLTALQQAAAVRAGEVSPTELVEHSLARIEALDAKLGAFITVTPERALEAAGRAESLVRRGGGHAGELPPLLGVPTAIKDLNNTAGIRTTFGSTVMTDFVPDADDAVVVKLAAAGTISLGKTNTPEFGLPCYTDNGLVGPARCPWDPSRLAGGSSGGAAVAVASGMVPVAQGSDGGGSIRIPASINGLFGIKPTRGRVSNAPYGGDVKGLGTNGPGTRAAPPAAPAPGPPPAPPRCPTRLPAPYPATRPGRHRCPPASRSWAPPTGRSAGCGSAASASRRCPASSSSSRSRTPSRTPPGCSRAWATTSRTCPRGCSAPTSSARSRRSGRWRVRPCPCRPSGRGSCGRSPANCGAEGWRCRPRTPCSRCSRCGCSPAGSCTPPRATTSCWRRWSR